ncbi:alpha/beta hydrolase [Arthrobacter sp. zg-Y820]|uniref:alpha/beta hydrolase n=1 Tax=unclassified Arthrobacter TaxID=235627 RepID=UPI001E4F8A1A|nr:MULTISPECIES: alpha/beta hydrolase [unclassified Arthrobacter]MCC9195270.1 alpha/beta hydrolase family protein [Arthrobacter sp. zg-Y820]MDK1278129.1 alpha/beta hydrolase [Arthrobacter sp. zg.Y820]WIB10018.1 alpha/beta hydrolase [Arthrobacter sp. zg-Y820]
MTRYIHIELHELRMLPDGEPIQARAREILDGAAVFADAIESLQNKWQGLGGLYAAPEQDLVLRAFDAPAAHTREYTQSSALLRAALDRFGSELIAIETQRRMLETEIEAAYQRLDDELREMKKDNASQRTMEAVRAAATEPLQAKADLLAVHFEQASEDCLAALAGISRSTPDVVSSYSSSRMDLFSALRREMDAAFRKAAARDATPADIRALYAQLTLLGPELLSELGRRPEARLFVAGLSPHEEANFWAKLNGPQQAALAAALPGLVGNLEGAPYKVRDKANRRVLAAVQQRLGRTPAGTAAGGRKARGAAWRPEDLRPMERSRHLERTEAVDALTKALGGAGEKRQLISFDPGTNVPLAAISVGEDLDSASNVSFLVPGMNTSTKQAASLVDNARSLGREQRRIGVHGGSTAVVAYMGYEPPTELTVGGAASAEKGAPALAAALDGLYLGRTADGAPPPEVNVVAHSYGTTMAALALDQTQYRVTAAVLLASAGVQPDSADTLNVDLATDGAVDVYVTLASADRVAEMGTAASEIVAIVTLNPAAARLDPLTEAWGGRVFSSDRVTVDGKSFAAVGGHGLGGYLGQDSFSLHFTALVTGGRAEEALAMVAAQK